MALTKLENLINPQVMQDMISAELPNAIKFLPLADVDYTLQGQPGNTVTVPKFNYIGDATVVAEGEPIDLTQLTTSTDQATVRKVAKGGTISDESALSGLGNPIGATVEQILKSIAAGIDNEVLAAVASAPLSYQGNAFDIDTIDNAIALFNDENDEVGAMVLFVNSKDALKLRKAAGQDWTRASELGDQILIKGTFGELLGAQVVRSNKLEEGTAYLVKRGALKLYMKRDASVEKDRNIVTKETVVTGDQHFAAHLYDESKVIKISVSAGA
ncbi:N4-gp56 family major capsid protein [Rossellomorea marisflavi]|uniref:N4-gp56 family major capsid protein n=1 Tax=Rossellomorea marisflavi TaxID=189381 RepID=UPI003D2F329B